MESKADVWCILGIDEMEVEEGDVLWIVYQPATGCTGFPISTKYHRRARKAEDLRNAIFLLVSVLVQLSSSSLSAPSSEDLDFDESTVLRDRLFLLVCHKVKVSGLNTVRFHGRAAIFVIPAITRLVQCLLHPALVLDSRIDAPGSDVSSVHEKLEE